MCSKSSEKQYMNFLVISVSISGPCFLLCPETVFVLLNKLSV